MAWYYEDLAKKANQLGFSVYLHEYRKHGRTEADYGDGNIFLTFASDAAQMLTRIRQENPGKKVFLVCHSLGTGIAQFAIAKEGAKRPSAKGKKTAVSANVRAAAIAAKEAAEQKAKADLAAKRKAAVAEAVAAATAPAEAPKAEEAAAPAPEAAPEAPKAE
jgi:pimeloyl-ACP methyl ester carboxylesterase